ncbi:hypothetical protein BJX99DRAFT_260931 [Aspergillus californicus]
MTANPAVQAIAVPDPAVLQAPSLSYPPLHSLQHRDMFLEPLRAWRGNLVHSKPPPSRCAVTKVEHMKNFHFSAFMHEFLRVTVQDTDAETAHDEKPVYLIFERDATNRDWAGAGWEWVQPPRLTGWWIERLLLGYFSEPTSDDPEELAHWKAIGYSGSDFLSSLTFAGGGVSLLELADELVRLSEMTPRYSLLAAGNYWYALALYEGLKERWVCAEHKGDYYEHRGRFAGVRWGSPVLAAARKNLWWIAVLVSIGLALAACLTGLL